MGRVIRRIGETWNRYFGRPSSATINSSGYDNGSQDVNSKSGYDSRNLTEVLYQSNQESGQPTLSEPVVSDEIVNQAISGPSSRERRRMKIQEHGKQNDDSKNGNGKPENYNKFEGLSLSVGFTELDDDGRRYEIKGLQDEVIYLTKFKKKTGRLREIVYETVYRKKTDEAEKKTKNGNKTKGIDKKTNVQRTEDEKKFLASLLSFDDLTEQEVFTLIDGVKNYYRPRIDEYSDVDGFDEYSPRAKQKMELEYQVKDVILGLRDKLQSYKTGSQKDDKKSDNNSQELIEDPSTKVMSKIDSILSEFGQRDDREKQTPQSVIEKYRHVKKDGKEVDLIKRALTGGDPLYMSELDMAIYVQDSTLAQKSDDALGNIAIESATYRMLETLANGGEPADIKRPGGSSVRYYRNMGSGCRLFVDDLKETLYIVAVADGTAKGTNEQDVIDRLRKIDFGIKEEFTRDLPELKKNDEKFLEELKKQKQLVGI
ncbi:MAG: hypothetical protein HY831_03040 [Candidatus Aenigmarchaeota archaeon]|nr:hypothetical protein [Candidatus Aenigmarchaeota archaeon]